MGLFFALLTYALFVFALLCHLAHFLFADFTVAISVDFVEVLDESIESGFGGFIGGDGSVTIPVGIF